MSIERSFLRYRNRLEKVFGKKGKENKAKVKIPTKQNKVLLEPLEPRLLLSSDLTYNIGTAHDVSLRMQNVGGTDTLQVVNDANSAVLLSQSLADTEEIVITGSGGDDEVTIDFSTPFSRAISFTDTSTTDHDTLAVIGGDRTWNITGQNAGSTIDDNTETVTFSGMENLQGGDNEDSFIFGLGGSLTGRVDGGAGVNTLDYSAFETAVNVNLTAGTATAANGGIANIRDVIGGSGKDTMTGDGQSNILVGGAGNDTYVFDADTALGTDTIIEFPDGGTDTLDFSTTTTLGVNIDLSNAGSQTVNGNLTIDLSAGDVIENVIGGSGADTITGNSLDNVFIGGRGADTVTGGGGVDTIAETRDANFTLSNTSLIISGDATDALSGIGAARLTGGSGGNLLDASGFTLGPVTLDGGGGSDTLKGGARNDILIGGAGTDSLAGGGGDDTYIFAPGGGNDTIAEAANGGNDTLDYSAYTSGINVTLGGSATGVSGNVSNIENVIGGTGDDRITGDSKANRLAGGTGTNILAGTSGDDTYVLTEGETATITESANGGNDTLDYSAYTSGINVTLGGSATGVSGNVLNIENVIGGAGDDKITGDGNANVLSGGPGNDTLTGGAGGDTYILIPGQGVDIITELAGDIGTDTILGSNVDTDWYITGVNSGTVAGSSFANIERLVGGTGDDNFIFESTGSMSSGIEGGGQVFGDTVLAPDTANIWNITGSNAGTLAGHSSFTGIENLMGGEQDDSFVFKSGGAVSGLISGGADDASATTRGVDTLDYSSFSGAITINLATMMATGTGGFTAIDKVKGGSSNDTIVGPDDPVVQWTIDQRNAGQVSGILFEHFENLTGTSNTTTDAFTFEKSGSISGTVSGGTGNLDAIRVAKPSSGYTVFNPTSADQSGTLNLNGKRIQYTGMDPQNFMSSTGTDKVIRGTMFGDTIIVEDIPDTAGQTGLMQVSFVGLETYDGTTTSGATYRFTADPFYLKSLTVEAKWGADTIEVKSLDPVFSAKLFLYGNQGGDPALIPDLARDEVRFSGDTLTHGGYLEVFADKIFVNDNVTVSTLANGLTGDGEDIVFRARRINMTELTNISPLMVMVRDAEVNIGAGAKLFGGGVYLFSQAEDRSLTTLLGTDRLVNNYIIQPLLNKVADLLAMPIKVLYKESEATITVGGGAQIIGSGTVGLYATAASDATGEAKSKFFSVGYGQAKATASVDIAAGAVIQSTGAAVVVTSDAKAIAKMTTETKQDQKDDSGIAGSLAVSNSEVKSTVTLAAGATVEAAKTANLRANGDITSETESKGSTFASGKAGMGFGLSFSSSDIHTQVDGTVIAHVDPNYLVKIEINPTVKYGDAVYTSDQTVMLLSNGETVELLSDQGDYGTGTVLKYVGTALSNVNLSSQNYNDLTLWQPTTPNLGWVDYLHDRIYVGGTGLVTEDTVNYDTRRGTKIGGLLDDQDYVIISVADKASTILVDESGYIQLASTEQNAIEGKALPLWYDTRPGYQVTNNTKNFDGDEIDSNRSRITLDNPAFHENDNTVDWSLLGMTFELGQAVVYHEGRDAAGNKVHIQGLEDGHTYYVITGINEFDLQGDNRFVQHQVIQLAETEMEARAGVNLSFSIDPNDVGAKGFSLEAKHLFDSKFSNGVGILATLKAEDKAKAEAGVEDESKLPAPLEFVKSTIDQLDVNLFDKLVGKLMTIGGQNAAQSGANNAGVQGSSVQAAGAFAFSYADHKVTTDVGSTAVIKSNEDLEVKATIDHEVQVSAEASVAPPEAGSGGGGGSKLGGSVAVDIGLFTADAEATIHTGAQLDALRATRVISLVEHPYLKSPDEFFPSTLGEFLSSIQSEGPEALTKYLNSTLGIKDEMFNSWARAEAESDNVSIAGMVNVLSFNNTAKSLVETGALINQNTNWRDPVINVHENNIDEQVVSVEASNYMELINMTGFVGLKLPNVKAGEYNPIELAASKSKKGGVGGALFVLLIDNTTHSTIQDGAEVYSGMGGTFNMKADEAIFNIDLGQAGAAAGKVSVGGTVMYTGQDSDTVAQLGAGVEVTGREASIYAANLETNAMWAGGVALGSGIGAGISVAVNDIDRHTAALIGDESNQTPLTADDVPGIKVAEDVTARAIVGGELWAFTVAGAVVTPEKDTATSNAPGGTSPQAGARTPQVNNQQPSGNPTTPPSGGNEQKTGIAIAAAAGVNLVKENTQASVIDAGVGTDKVEAGSLSLTAENRTRVVAATGGLAFTRQKGGSTAVSLAGAFSYNDIDATTKTLAEDTDFDLDGSGIEYSLTDPTVRNPTVRISSLADGQIIAAAAGGAGSIAAGGTGGGGTGGSTAVAVAGSVSVNTITSDNSAAARNTHFAITSGTPGDASNGNVQITASDESRIFALGGGLALSIATGPKGNSTAVSAGIAVAVNEITTGTTATIENSTVTWGLIGATTLSRGDLLVSATSAETINAYTIAGAVSVANGTAGSGIAGAGAASGSINQIDVDTRAVVLNSVASLGTGSATVRAEDTAKISSGAGGIGVAVGIGGKGNGGAGAFGAAFSVNSIGTDNDNNFVWADVNNSQITAGGDITVSATNAADIFALAIGAAGSVTQSGTGNAISGSLAGSASINEIRINTQALVRNGSRLTTTPGAGGAVYVGADDDSGIDAVAGEAALSISVAQTTAAAVGLGCSLTINDIKNTTRSAVEDSSISTGSTGAVISFQVGVGGPTYTAGETAIIAGVGTISIAANGAYTFTPVAGYSGTLPVITYTLRDKSGNTETSTLNITVDAADDNFTDKNESVSTLQATTNTGNVIDSVDGFGAARVDSFQVGGTTYAAGKTAFIGGVGSIYIGSTGAYTFTPDEAYTGIAPVITYTLKDKLGNTETSTLTITVDAKNDPFRDASESVSTTADKALSGNLIGGTVAIWADSDAEINSLAFGISVGVAVSSSASAIAVDATGAMSFNKIDKIVEATVRDTSAPGAPSLTAGGAVSVTASDDSSIKAVATAATASISGTTSATSVSVSIGLALAHNTIDEDVSASLLSAGTVLTDGKDLTVSAGNSSGIEAATFAAAASVAISTGGVSVGVAGGASESTNVILSRTNAYIENSEIGKSDNKVGKVDLDATGTGKIDAIVGAIGAAVAVGNTGVGVGVGIAVARNFIGWDPTGESVTPQYQSTSTDTQGNVFGTTVNALTPGMTVRISSGALTNDIYEYIGPTVTDSDPNRAGIQNFDLSVQQYRDATLWKHVNVKSEPAQVQAYLKNSSVWVVGDLTVDAQATETIDAIVVAAAVGVGGGTTTGVGISAGGSYAENKIKTDIKAYIDGDGSGGINAQSVGVTADDSSGINAIAGAGSIAAGFGSTVGVAVSVGLSLGFNKIENDVKAYITNADQGVKTSGGDIAISALSQGQHLFDMAVDTTTTGLINPDKLDDAAIADMRDDDTANGNEAVDDANGDRVVLEALRAAFTANNETLAMYDTVGTAAKYSTTDGMQDVREGDTVRLAKGYANGGLEGRVYRYIGMPSHTNNINLSTQNYATDTTKWQLVDKLKVSTLVEGQSWMLTAPDGKSYALELSADGKKISVSRGTINAVSAAASLALGVGGAAGITVSGAGAVAQNVILTKTNAYGKDSLLGSAGDVTVNAASTSKISSTIVAASLAIGGGGTAGVGASIGVSVARNFIGWTPDGTNTPAQVQAYLSNTSVSAGGDLKLTSLADQKIGSVVIAGSAAVGLGGVVGVGASGSGVWAENKIGVDVKSYIDGDRDSGTVGISADSVTLTADDTSTIKALAGAASLAGSVGGIASVSFSIGVSLARNTITSEVDAYIKHADALPGSGADYGVTATTAKGITISASERARIKAVSFAASLGAGFAGIANVSVSGAGADANNVILTGTNAYVEDSALNSAGVLDIDASNTATIKAAVVSASASISVGGIVGVGASVGVAVARNYIGWDPNYNYPDVDYSTGGQYPVILVVPGTTVQIASGPNAGNVYEYTGTLPLIQPNLSGLDYSDDTKWKLLNLEKNAAKVQAYILNSNVDATGALTADAISNQTIDATVFAGSVAVSGGLVAVSLSGAGASTDNRVATSVQAYIEGYKDSKGIQAASVGLNAKDTSTIEGFTGAASVALSFGIGTSVSIGIGVAKNEITNDVEAYARNTKIVTTGGDLVITATETANVKSTAMAAAVAGGLTSVAGGGAVSKATIATVTKATADPVELDIARDIKIDAISSAAGTTDAITAAISASLIPIAAGVTKSTVDAKPITEARLGGYSGTGETRKVQAGEAISVIATQAGTAKATSTLDSLAIGIGISVGDSTATATIGPAAADTPTVKSWISAGTIVSKGGAANGGIDVKAVYNTDEGDKVVNGSGATADLSSRVGGAIAVGDVNGSATSKADTEALVDSSALLDASGAAVNVSATAENIATTYVESSGGGLISVGNSDTTATANGRTAATLLGNIGSAAKAGAATVTVLAQGTDESSSRLTSGTGGFVNVTSATANAITGTTENGIAGAATTATIGTNGSWIVTTGDISVKAVGMTDADSSTKSSSGGFVNVDNFASYATATPKVTTTVGSGTHLKTPGEIKISALHNTSGLVNFEGKFDASSNNVSDAGNTITFSAPTGLTTGDVVTYDALGTTPVVGLNSGRQYGVIVSDAAPNSLQLGATFNGASVDLIKDEIVFAKPHNLEDGDKVYYIGPEAGGTAVGGLVSGTLYQVNKIDDLHIKLLVPGQSTPSATTTSGSTIASNTINLSNSFTAGTAVTYHAPSSEAHFTSVCVDATVNGFNLVTEKVDGKVQVKPEDNNAIIADWNGDGLLDAHNLTTGTALKYTGPGIGGPTGGLKNDTIYYAIVDDSKPGQFKLALTSTDATAGTAVALVPDTSTSGSVADHKFTRVNDPKIPELVEGQTYFVANPGSGFQLTDANGIVVALTDGSTGPGHTFAVEGLNLQSAGSGDQKLVLDIAPGSGKQELSTSIAGNTVAAVPGDLVVTASAAGGGGGFIDVKGGTAVASTSPTVILTVESSASLDAGQIDIGTNALGNAQGLSTNAGAGFVSVGEAEATGNVFVTSKVSVLSNATLTATGDIKIQSTSNLDGDSQATSKGKAGIDIVKSRATTDLDYDTGTTVDGHVTAGNALNVEAHTFVDGYAYTHADARGLGANADANDTGGQGLRIGGTKADNLVDIQDNAVLTGKAVELDAIVDKFKGLAVSKAYAKAAGTDCDSRADITAGGTSEVLLETGSNITGNTSVLIQAQYLDVNLVADPSCHSDAIGGDTDSRAKVDVNTYAKVTGRDEAIIRTADLDVDTTQSVIKYDRSPSHDGAWIDTGKDYTNGSDQFHRDIFWESRVIMLSNEPNPEVVIDSTGIVSKLTPNVTLTDQNGKTYKQGEKVDDGVDIIVNDIINHATGGNAEFRANSLDSLDAVDGDNDTIDKDAPEHHNTPPLGQIWGNNADFEMGNTWDHVYITNNSDRDLFINDIDVMSGNGGTINVKVDEIYGPINTKPDSVSYMDEDVPTSPSNSWLQSHPLELIVLPTFEFEIVNNSFTRPQVRIENLQPGVVVDSNVILDGIIENPVGITQILNQRGDILSDSTDADVELIRTNELDLHATTGTIGQQADTGARVPITVELVKFADPAGAAKDMILTADAGKDVVLDITAHDRSLATAATSLTVNIQRITAGDDVDLVINDSKAGTDLGGSGGVEVNLYNPPDVTNRIESGSGGTTSFADAESGNYFVHFRPDALDGGFANIGRALGLTSSDINSTYNFAEVRAGDDIDIGHISTTGLSGEGEPRGYNLTQIVLTDTDRNGVPEVTITPEASPDKFVNFNINTDVAWTGGHTTDSTPQIFLTTNGDIVANEIAGDMLVGHIHAEGYVHYNPPFPLPPLPPLFPAELTRHGGNVTLSTTSGSILDAANDGTSDVDAQSVDIDANGGSIGTALNDLEIDSFQRVPDEALALDDNGDDVGLEASTGIYLTETAGKLRLVLAHAYASDIRLTVNDSTAAGEDLELIRSGKAFYAEADTTQRRDMAHGMIFAESGDVLLRVGDDVTTDENSVIVAAHNIDIYGDNGGNVDTSGTTMLLCGWIGAGVSVTPGNPLSPSNAFGTYLEVTPHTAAYLTQIHGNTNADDILFGRTPGGSIFGGGTVPGYIYLGSMTIVYGSDADDTIDARPITNTGIIIFGGAGADKIWGSQSNDLIIGDNGKVRFASDLIHLDEVWSDPYLSDSGVTTQAYLAAGTGTVYGGNDTISGEGGSDTVIGGAGQDAIYSDNLTKSNGGNDGQAILIGDNARIFYAGATGQFYTLGKTPILGILTTDTDSTTGAKDTMTGNSNAVDVLIGGVGVGAEADTLNGDPSIDVIENDNCFVIFVVDQMTAKGAVPQPSTEQLNDAELAPIVAQAKALWANALGNDSRLSSLDTVQIKVSDLPGDVLGLTAGNTIFIDTNAAGHGWYIDPTPADDSEFTRGPKPAGIDLLTVVTHEMGHVLGLPDVSAGTDNMKGSLGEGARLVPTASSAYQYLDDLRKEDVRNRFIVMPVDGSENKGIQRAMEHNPNNWLLDFLVNRGGAASNPNRDIAITI